MRAIPDEWTRLLFVNWVQHLCEERLGTQQSGTSGSSWTFGDPTGVPVRVTLEPPEFALQVDVGSADVGVVEAIVQEAWQAAHERNLGSGHWRTVAFAAEYALATAEGDLHFTRLLGDHGGRRLTGPARFGSDVIFEFQQRGDATSPLPLPNFEVKVTFRVPGPGAGPFTDRAAIEMATLLRAVLTYATATAVSQQGPALWPAEDDELERARSLLGDSGVGELTVDGNVLAPRMYEFATADPDREVLRRVHGGLYAYEQALLQASEFVCLVMLVSAIEALATPNAEWRRSRLTKRFVSFLLQACSQDVSNALKHRQFVQAFGVHGSPKRFLEALYDRRSRPLHTGFLQHNASGMFGMLSDGAMRVALVADITRAALRSFIAAPFSSLVGHPDIAPGAS